MGYTFPKELKIVTEQGESARFAADFLKDEIFSEAVRSFLWKCSRCRQKSRGWTGGNPSSDRQRTGRRNLHIDTKG